MTENERELMQMIRQHPDPEKAFDIALKIILEFLEQDELSQEQPSAYFQVSS